jgi:hypothetical protein
VLSVNPSASVIYSNSVDDQLINHIRVGSMLAGYISAGAHTSLGNQYAINPFYITWTGNSSWWIIETVESFNGQWTNQCSSQGSVAQWFSASAFGGTNYSNIPVGAVSHVNEPGASSVNNAFIYFGLWEAKKDFAICAWNSRRTQYFQAIGDPLIVK